MKLSELIKDLQEYEKEIGGDTNIFLQQGLPNNIPNQDITKSESFFVVEEPDYLDNPELIIRAWPY